jgi:hypothetical protein
MTAMKIIKKVDLGEYIIEIEYDEMTGALDVTVYDELNEIVEGISISYDADDDDTSSNFDPNLN